MTAITSAKCIDPNCVYCRRLTVLPAPEEQPTLPGIPVGDTPPSAPDLLAKAAGHMLDRAATYDQPGGERSAGKIVAAFNAITGRDLTEPEGWLFLQLLKQVRLFSAPGYHADSAEDNIAYAALLAEAKGRL